MKTREIDVWVNKDSFMNKTDARTNVCSYQFINSIKAKLIIEIPERKIEITESDVDNAFNSIRYLERHEDSLCAYTVKWLKEKLFAE